MVTKLRYVRYIAVAVLGCNVSKRVADSEKCRVRVHGGSHLCLGRISVCHVPWEGKAEAGSFLS